MKGFTLAVTAAIVASTATSTLAVDIDVGTVLAFDRQANTLVLIDRSAWSLGGESVAVPEDLSAGDRVQFGYKTDVDGPAEIFQINIVRKAPEPGSRNVNTGTVLAYDRRARLLIFDDKSAWSLQDMQDDIPIGLDAGDRIEIEYEPGGDDIARIRAISILLD